MLTYDEIQQVDALSKDIASAIEIESYDLASNLLTKRLAILKIIDVKVKEDNLSGDSLTAYHDFLRSIQVFDMPLMQVAANARQNHLEKSSKQAKRKVAINAYKSHI